MKKTALALRPRGTQRRPQPPAPPDPLRLNHYKHVYWEMGGGPLVTAYRAVVVHDGCTGCLVCAGTTDWFMEFARLTWKLIRVNLRDCLHWGPLHDNPRPLIAPASNLCACDHMKLERLRTAYYALPEASRPRVDTVPDFLRPLGQTQRFETSLALLGRMVDLWEDGQYIGWPS
jgi:hypothetical protein